MVILCDLRKTTTGIQRKQSKNILNSSKCRRGFEVKKILPTYHVQVVKSFTEMLHLKFNTQENFKR